MELRGTYKGGGGPDKTILLSAAKHDKNRFFILVTYLRNPNDDDFQIGDMAKRMGVSDYIEVFDRSMLDVKCLFQLNSLAKKNSVQIIHIHDLKTTLLGFLLKVLNPRAKIMHTAHGWIINSQLDSLKQKIQYMMLKFYPLHIAVSEATRKLMIKSGINPNTIRVLYNSIDIDYWQKDGEQSTVRSEFGIPDDSFIVGTVGRVSREKDLPTFFRVAQNVLDVYPNTYFLIVGDGKGEIVNESHKLAIETGIDRSFIFTGHRIDLKNIYASLDLFLTTSLTEGLPNTLLEAMAMEVPIVATGVGGVPELIEDGKTGVLCNVGDVDGITSMVLGLLADSGKREEFAVNGRARIVEKFSFNKRLEIIEDYYWGLARDS